MLGIIHALCKITGYFVILYPIWLIAKAFYIFKLSKNIDLKKYGDWVVVTGATDGIGKEYVLNAAKQGCKIFLISRNASKLKTLAEELEKEYKVVVEWLAVDFKDDNSIYEKIADRIASKNVALLVNNVGIGVQREKNFYQFSELTYKEVHECQRVNMFSVAKMCRIVLPKMIDQKRGIIVNISSASAVFPLKFKQIYGSTKRFVTFLSDSLRMEVPKSLTDVHIWVGIY